MYAVDPKLLSRLQPRIRRVLIVDSQPASAKMLGDLMRGLGTADVAVADDDRPALEMLRHFNPDVVFVEGAAAKIDGPGFTRKLRRSDHACRRAPVIVTSSEATAALIKACRDTGAHEFLRKPFTAGDLLKRIEAVALKPRDWIEAVAYVGPDRRRFNSADYSGPRKREADRARTGPEARAQRLDQALRILQSALVQFDDDPPQALRSMREQAAAMAALSVEMGLPRLGDGARLLDAALARPQLTKADIRPAVKAVVDLFEPNAPAVAAA